MMNTDRYYADQADKLERDPYGPDGGGRAVVVNGRGFQKWQRFHKGDVVWVQDADGRDAWLTRLQADLYQLAVTFIDNGTTTIRFLAQELKCSPSTVSRGMVRLASLGLLAALTGRGRYSGTLIFRLPKDGSLDRFRRLAKDKVRAWAKAAQERLSRLQANVAVYSLDRERGIDSLYWYTTSVSTSKAATLKRQWTPEELRDAGII
jgi:predicted transcriptional regulator